MKTQRRFMRIDTGHTNNVSELIHVREFRDASVADGWTIQAAYANESVDRAAMLHREGFKMFILTREDQETWRRFKYTAQICIWGPERPVGLNIRVPEMYSWSAITEALRQCTICQQDDVETFVWSFAGRACAGCLPSQKTKHERNGWYN
jgi:hypothetical protein